MLALEAALTARGRKVDSYIHDAVLVRRTSEQEAALPPEVLAALSTAVATATGFRLTFATKTLSTTFEVPARMEWVRLPSAAGLNEAFAAERFAELMASRITLHAGAVHVFDDETGMWTAETKVLRRYMHRMKHQLIFVTTSAKGEDVFHDFSGDERRVLGVLRSLPAHVPDTNFFEETANTSIGKLLFTDGIYDMDTAAFTSGFNPAIVFNRRINRPFPKVRDAARIAEVRRLLFEDPFPDEHGPVGVHLLSHVAHGVWGNFRRKRAIFLVGNTNACKSVLVGALKASLDGFAAVIDADNLLLGANEGPAGHVAAAHAGREAAGRERDKDCQGGRRRLRLRTGRHRQWPVQGRDQRG